MLVWSLRAGCRAAPAVVGLIYAAHVGDAGLQAQNRNRIPAFRGQVHKLRAWSAFPMLAPWVFTSGASLVTSTSTRVVTTCIVKFIVAGELTWRVTSSRFNVAKPLGLTLTR
jgi:hypothetical protein